MTIHDFDMARFLIGSEVEEVFTAAGVSVDPGIGEAGDLDTAVILLRFKNGVIGTIDNCRKAVYGYDQRVEVLGSDGSISTGNCYPNQAVIRPPSAIREDLPLHFFMDRYAESFANELRAFVKAVLEGSPTPVSGIDGRIPVVMGLAARKSHDEHRAVRLEEISRALPCLDSGGFFKEIYDQGYIDRRPLLDPSFGTRSGGAVVDLCPLKWKLFWKRKHLRCLHSVPSRAGGGMRLGSRRLAGWGGSTHQVGNHRTLTLRYFALHG